MKFFRHVLPLALAVLNFSLPAQIQATSRKPAAVTLPNPDAVCANCHQAIYSSYRKTPMARASGLAKDGLLPGEFTHTASGIHYRLYLKNGHAWLSFDRPNAPPDRTLDGERELVYFIGSGNRGRTYLFQTDGFWFESPVNWYSRQKVWDMNPKSLHVTELPLTLPVDATCLHCHTSGVQAELPGARDHFAAQPFLYGGVTCEGCHGDPSVHLATHGRGPILNPAKLSPDRRDSICLQCHLEGVTAVNRVGRSLADFVPGQKLSDDVTHYAYASAQGPPGRAASQWEALLQSECKRKSGDKLTCTTCHDPHSTPTPAERVSYFRARCLQCHGAPTFVSKHHPDQPDCASCHMPREKTQDVAHEQVTDHRIPRYPRIVIESVSTDPQVLKAIDEVHPGDRDLGLAYFQLAEHGNRDAGERAMLLLESAERAGKQPDPVPDPDLHTALGFLKQVSGDPKGAMVEYHDALAANPDSSIAAGDLAILDARAGNAQDALPLLQTVSRNDPAQTGASLDLALVECAIGNDKAATEALNRLLKFSPDDRRARKLMTTIQHDSDACGR